MNDYGVKYSTVVKDNDFQALRDSPLFDDISNELKGASTESQLAKFRTEAKVRTPSRSPAPAAASPSSRRTSSPSPPVGGQLATHFGKSSHPHSVSGQIGPPSDCHQG